MTALETFASFIQRIPNLKSLHRQDVARYFVYFLTMKGAEAAAAPSDVARLFREADLAPWDDVRFYLSKAAQKKSKGETPAFIHTGKGYRLERTERERIQATLLNEPHKRETDAALQSLIGKLAAGTEQSFLSEAVLCYEVGAYRAAIVMTWNLALDHLFEFILRHKLVEFNAALAKVTDKRVKTNTVSTKDDFSDIPENKFIEISRSAGVINNDVRKILDAKLGIRNSYAHPSTLVLSPVSASESIQDLVNNVITKFTL